MTLAVKLFNTNDFWHEGGAGDDGVTPPRPTRGCEWVAPRDYPGHDRPFTWSQ